MAYDQRRSVPRHGDVYRVAFATAHAYRELSDDDRLAVEALTARGCVVDARVWDDPTVDWLSYDAVVVRSCWDYHLAPDRFLAWVGTLEASGVAIWNPPGLIRWNGDKRYLRDLERAGVATVPTASLPRAEADRLHAFVDELEWDEVVVKPAISASAFRTLRLVTARRNEILSAARHVLEHGDLLVQPFLDAVVREGEWALVFFDGQYSHSVLKRPADGDFRVQQEWGGRETPVRPERNMLDAASRAVEWAGPSLYARVDGVVHEGQFLLMELELIEPYLFLVSEPTAAGRFADAIGQWLLRARS